VDGTPVWSHEASLHRRILQDGREAHLRQGRVSEGSGPSLQLESRRKTPRRAIDIHEGEEVDESAFKALVRQAVALNSSGKSKAFEENEVLRDSVPEQVRRRGRGGMPYMTSASLRIPVRISASVREA